MGRRQVSAVLGPLAVFCLVVGVASGQVTHTRVAVTGDPAPGLPAGNLTSFFAPTIDQGGRVAFHAGVTGQASNDSGLWTGQPGALQLLAREGSQAAGLPPGVLYGPPADPPGILTGHPVIAGGQVAFFAPNTLTGSGVNPGNDSALWRGMPGDVRLIAREGDPAPGTTPGVHFSAVSGQLNGNGFAVVLGAIDGPGVDPTNSQVLYGGRPGALSLIARAGQPFDIGGGVTRTVAQNGLVLYNSGTEDGGHVGFNDAGQLAFLANFTDGTSGIFIAAVPEPSSLAALAAGVLLIRRRRGSAERRAV